MRHLSSLSGLVLISAVAAQTPAFISPVAAGTTLGNSNNNIPFSWSPSAYQQIHSLSSFTNQTVGVWTQMRMRMGSGFTNYAGKTIDVELYLAQCPTPSTGANSVFANNVVGTTENNVFTRKMLNLPTVPDNSWAVPFVFDTPFVWPATHLAWRTNVWGNSNNNMLFTYPLDAFWHLNNGTSFGTGCKAANASSNSSHSSALGSPGRNASFYGYSYINNTIPAHLAFGSNTSLWGGLPLPFSLASLGAPGCNVYIDWIATMSNVTNATGQVTFTTQVPNVPSLADQTLLTQVIFLDANANGLGAITTNGFNCKIGTDPGMTRIYAINSPGGLSGTLDIGFGMSVGFN